MTGSMCKNNTPNNGYEQFTTNMSFDLAIYIKNLKKHGTSNLTKT